MNAGRTRRLVWFLAVGGSAAALHFGVVLALVARAGVAPLWANLAGWVVSFGLSFNGHQRLTFATEGAPAARSLRRFFLVSALGFGVNEAAYALLLGFSGLGYQAALAVVLCGVAVFTYWAGRHWAFLGNRAPGAAQG